MKDVIVQLRMEVVELLFSFVFLTFQMNSVQNSNEKAGETRSYCYCIAGWPLDIDILNVISDWIIEKESKSIKILQLFVMILSSLCSLHSYFAFSVSVNSHKTIHSWVVWIAYSKIYFCISFLFWLLIFAVFMYNMFVCLFIFIFFSIAEVSEGRETLTEGRHEFNFAFDLPMG